MESCVNAGARKANYERGLKHGDKVYCGQDLRELVGMRIVDVNSDDLDSNVVVWLEGEEKQVAIYFDNLCFDGDHMSLVEHDSGYCGTFLRTVTENDLQEFANMIRYYDNDIVGANDEKIGLKHMYCNDIELEGTEQFAIKSLYVFYDGRILTEK